MHRARDDVGELVLRALKGDRDAIAALYRLHERALIGVAHRRLGHTLHGLMDSVDLVQSAWKDALQSLEKFEPRGPDSFYKWLHTCLIHKIESKRRHHQTQRRDIHRLRPLAEVAGSLERRPGAGDLTPSQQVSRADDLARLLEILDRLPAVPRRVLLLRMRDEMSFAQIGRHVGKSEETAKKIYQRAFRHLLELLPEEWRAPS